MSYTGPDRRHEPQPLTEDQLKLIAAETQNAANKVLKRYRNSAIAGFLILCFAIGYVFADNASKSHDRRQAIVTSGKIVAIDGCNRDFKSTKVLRGLLRDGQAEIDKAAKKGLYSEEQLQDARDFYAKQLRAVAYPNCKAAGTILTSDKDKLPSIPKPLVPTKADK
jgi:hypothetical protein